MAEASHEDNEAARSQRRTEIERLAAGIAQEIWNPLGVVKTMVFAMHADTPEQDTRSADFEIIHEEIARMEESLQRFLDYTHPHDPDLAPARLCEVVGGAERLLIDKAEAQGVRIDVRVDDDVMVLADYEQLEQVFVNLGMNALHAMPEGGELSIVSRREQIYVDLALNAVPAKSRSRKPGDTPGDAPESEDAVGVDVSDTGQGIPDDLEGRIFEPFVVEGRGLGLALVRKIVERHGGRIAARNKPEGGATFMLTLPLFREGDLGKDDEEGNGSGSTERPDGR